MRFAELVNHRIFERKWRSREILRACLFECPLIKNTKSSVFNQIYFCRLSCVIYLYHGGWQLLGASLPDVLFGGVTLNLVHHWRASSQNMELLFNSPAEQLLLIICVLRIFITSPRWHACMKSGEEIRCGVCAFWGSWRSTKILFYNFFLFFAAFSTHAAKQIFFLELEFVKLLRNFCFDLWCTNCFFFWFDVISRGVKCFSFIWRQLFFWISNQTRQPAEFKHIIKRRKRN